MGTITTKTEPIAIAAPVVCLPTSKRRSSADLPVLDLKMPRCPSCGSAIESFGGGTRYKIDPVDGSSVKVVHASCYCGQRVKVRFL